MSERLHMPSPSAATEWLASLHGGAFDTRGSYEFPGYLRLNHWAIACSL
jgi:hypothetical protein